MTVVLLVGVVGVTTLTGCGGGTSGAPTGANETGPPEDLGEVVDLTNTAEVAVGVPDNSFKPRAFKVSAATPAASSTKVVFTNTGANAHNITPNEDGAWEPVVLQSGETKTMTVPAKPGTYRFYCTIHGTKTSGQRGAMIVVPPG